MINSFTLHAAETLEFLPSIETDSIDLIVADPPYFLSNGGTTCKSGKRTKVNKGKWDVSMGVLANHKFNRDWLAECYRILKPNGTIFVSGTHHIIYSIGYAMQCLNYKVLNDISWFKVNPPPNLGCRAFTHACETIIWASKGGKHCFNYKDMKAANGGKQMKSLWSITPPKKAEKKFGKHPTQKPIALLERIILAASNPGDLVLDPFCGSGTTGIAAAMHGRNFIGIDNSTEYLDLARLRYDNLSDK